MGDFVLSTGEDLGNKHVHNCRTGHSAGDVLPCVISRVEWMSGNGDYDEMRVSEPVDLSFLISHC